MTPIDARVPVYRCQYIPEFPPPEPLAVDARRQTRAKLLRDDEAIHALFICDYEYILSPCPRHNDPLFGGEVVKLFLDSEDRRTHYFKFDISPRNWWPAAANTRAFPTASSAHPIRAFDYPEDLPMIVESSIAKTGSIRLGKKSTSPSLS